MRIKQPNYLTIIFITGIALYLVTLIIPLLLILKEGILNNGLSLVYFKKVFSDFTYIKVILMTFKISIIVAVICLLISYPFAMLLINLKGTKFNLLFLVYSIPLLISPLALLYSWMIILQKDGLINFLIKDILHFTRTPLNLIYNDFGVIIAMVFLLSPYAILLTYLGLLNIETRIFRAAKNMGASRYQMFMKITLPLSIHGAIIGSLFVFILALGYFVVPALFGGLNQTMISMVIENRMNSFGDWGIASTLSLILLIFVILFLVLIIRLILTKQLFKKELTF